MINFQHCVIELDYTKTSAQVMHDKNCFKTWIFTPFLWNFSSFCVTHLSDLWTGKKRRIFAESQSWNWEYEKYKVRPQRMGRCELTMFTDKHEKWILRFVNSSIRILLWIFMSEEEKLSTPHSLKVSFFSVSSSRDKSIWLFFHVTIFLAIGGGGENAFLNYLAPGVNSLTHKNNRAQVKPHRLSFLMPWIKCALLASTYYRIKTFPWSCVLRNVSWTFRLSWSYELLIMLLADFCSRIFFHELCST